MNFRKTAARHPGIRWALGAVEFTIVAVMLVAGIVPAWAAAISIPIAGRIYNLDFGDVPAWIVAAVAAGGFWKAWRAEQRAAEAVKLGTANAQKLSDVGVKIDGMLAERDKAKVKEGEEKGAVAAKDAADQLKRGVEQGIAQERASVAAANPSSVAVTKAGLVHGGSPVPVEDERAAKIGERTAAAAESSAAATEKLADATKDIADATKKV